MPFTASAAVSMQITDANSRNWIFCNKGIIFIESCVECKVTCMQLEMKKNLMTSKRRKWERMKDDGGAALKLVRKFDYIKWNNSKMTVCILSGGIKLKTLQSTTSNKNKIDFNYAKKKINLLFLRKNELLCLEPALEISLSILFLQPVQNDVD